MAFYVIANWKMNEGRPNTVSYARILKKNAASMTSRTIVVCPPFTHISTFAGAISGSRIRVGAQDISAHPEGAFTGDVSASLVRKAGASYVIVGHSERRTVHREGDTLVHEKVRAAFDSGLTPILCIGETKRERAQGKTFSVLRRQLSSALRSLPFGGKGLIIAYEPVWAISTARRALALKPDQIPPMLTTVRSLTRNATRRARGTLRELSIVYGGSVELNLARKITKRNGVDGLLVGGASLDAHQFAAIASS